MFKTKEDQKIFKEYVKNGYLIFDIKDLKNLDLLKKKTVKFIKKNLKSKYQKNYTDDYFLNNSHKIIKIKDLNYLRLKLISYLNSDKSFRVNYYNFVKPYLEKIVGNEIAMQQKINLSIQFPNDSSSLLPFHSDTWAGDSPFETVVWLPLVNCEKTKSMYIVPPNKMAMVNSLIKKKMTTDQLFKRLKSSVRWIKIKYGQILIFNQNLPHGNIVNKEKETRFSFNCRFKSIFAPYGDKKIGEFFEPITLKPASKLGMIYKYPKI